MRELVLGAKLDDILFNQLQIDESRDNFRRVLIETYFAPEIRPILIEVGVIASESFEYSKELTTQLRGRFKVVRDTPEVEHQYRTEARSTAFRRLVVEAYNHRCAVCKIKLLTPEGHTAISAAHIVPWSESHNDDPRNGMALCGLHHWAFDKGLVGVASDYRIMISPIVSMDGNSGEFVLPFEDKQIYCPENEVLFPAKLALKWHQKNIFRAEI